jgi:hypothetical protein
MNHTADIGPQPIADLNLKLLAGRVGRVGLEPTTGGL